MPQFLIVGSFVEASFHKCRLAAESVKTADKEGLFDFSENGMLPGDWELFMELQQQTQKGLKGTEGCLVFEGEKLVGSGESFVLILQKTYGYSEFRPDPLYTALASTSFKQYMETSGVCICDCIANLGQHTFCYFELTLGGRYFGILIFELFANICPKTCKNFETLCIGGIKGEKADNLSFQGSLFHRIVKGSWVQGGDICGGHGDGGESIYGMTFPDENFVVKHDKPGILGMCNKGPHTNSSQFYITLKSAPWMNMKYVAFGRLIQGFKLLRVMEELETENQRPLKQCTISKCGIYTHSSKRL